MASVELSRRVEKVVAYSRSPTASRASASVTNACSRTTLPSRRVHTFQAVQLPVAPLCLPRPWLVRDALAAGAAPKGPQGGLRLSGAVGRHAD
jgi:hypothetical protein